MELTIEDYTSSPEGIAPEEIKGAIEGTGVVSELGQAIEDFFNAEELVDEILAGSDLVFRITKAKVMYSEPPSAEKA